MKIWTTMPTIFGLYLVRMDSGLSIWWPCVIWNSQECSCMLLDNVVMLKQEEHGAIVSSNGERFSGARWWGPIVPPTDSQKFGEALLCINEDGEWVVTGGALKDKDVPRGLMYHKILFPLPSPPVGSEIQGGVSTERLDS